MKGEVQYCRKIVLNVKFMAVKIYILYSQDKSASHRALKFSPSWSAVYYCSASSKLGWTCSCAELLP